MEPWAEIQNDGHAKSSRLDSVKECHFGVDIDGYLSVVPHSLGKSGQSSGSFPIILC